MYQQRNEVHNNCGIEIYYQTDMQSTSENMFLELFCQIISEPCFNTLRTKEQLGKYSHSNYCLYKSRHAYSCTCMRHDEVFFPCSVNAV